MADRRATIQSGYVPVLIYTPVVLAHDRGYYQQFGVTSRLERLPTGADIVPHTLSGRFDVGIGGPGPDFWQAISEGRRLRLIAPLHAERPPAATPLIVRRDLFDSGEVASVEDLRGRPVSSLSLGAPLFWLASALETEDLTVDDVDLQIIGYDDVGAALSDGTIDAALLGEPLVTDLIDNGIATRLASDFVDGLQPTYLFALQETLDERRDDLVRFTAGYLLACADLESRDPARSWNADHVLESIASFTGIQGAEINEAMHPSYEPAATFHAGSLQRLYDFFLDRGAIAPIPNFDPESLIDETVGRDAVALIEGGTSP